MYYENFERLCKKHQTNASQVSKATGISTATLTNWKKGNYTPKQDKLQLIADYFNVSVDYLMTGKEPDFTLEMAEIDVKLTDMPIRLKEYALKLVSLPETKINAILSMIDAMGDD